MSDGEVSTAAAPDTGAKASTSGRAAMLLGVLWIAGAYATFLRYNAYPLWRFDVLAGMALLAVGPIAIGWIYGRLGRLARACVLGLFAYFVLATNDAGHHWALTGGIAVGIASYFIETVVLGFATVMAAVILAWPLLGLSERNPPIRTEGAPQSVATPGGPPPIIHLILDEHGGKPAFDQIDRHAPGTWAAIESAYLDQGFSVWRNAYSRYNFTIHSLPEQLGMTAKTWVKGHPRYATGQLRAIEQLARSNYRVQIFQSSDMDLCSGNKVVSCTTYSYASLDKIEQLRWPDRVLLLSSFFVVSSNFGDGALNLYHELALDLRERGWRIPILSFYRISNPAPLNTRHAFDLLVERAHNLGSGEALIAHTLFPHFPAAYDNECRLLPLKRWENQLSNSAVSVIGSSYSAQTLCTSRLVRNIVEAAPPDAIIIVHGDHGSRIVTRDLTAARSSRITPSDLAASYSTIFAVRIPGDRPRVEFQQSSVSSLLDKLAKKKWRSLPSEAPTTRPSVILLGGPDNAPLQVPLPNWNVPAAPSRRHDPKIP